MSRSLDPIESAILARIVAATELGANTARDTVPVQTGELKGSIRVETHEQGDRVVVAIVAGGDPDGDGKVVNYAMDVEMLNTPFLAQGHERVRGELRRIF